MLLSFKKKARTQKHTFYLEAVHPQSLYFTQLRRFYQQHGVRLRVAGVKAHAIMDRQRQLPKILCAHPTFPTKFF